MEYRAQLEKMSSDCLEAAELIDHPETKERLKVRASAFQEASRLYVQTHGVPLSEVYPDVPLAEAINRDEGCGFCGCPLPDDSRVSFGGSGTCDLCGNS